MSRVENRTTIKAEPEKVFSFLAERTNAPKIVPHLEKVWDIQPAAAGVGQTWKWAFKLFGMTFEGVAEMIEFSPGHRLQFKTTGKLRSYWTYAVERLPNDGGSAVMVGVSHDIPDSILGKAADRIALTKLGESSTKQILENLAKQFAAKPAKADKSSS
jgi:hypothetical protein